jgi:hypothetical protein
MDQLGFSTLLAWRAQSNGARLRMPASEQLVRELAPWSEMDRLAIGLLVAGVALGGVIAVAAGWHGLVVYGFLAILLGGASFGLRVGGGIIRDASAHRFERDRRRS